MRHPIIATLTGVLAAVVVACAGIVPVSAASPSDAPDAIARIDAGARGSIVVSKYEELPGDASHGNGLVDDSIAQTHTPIPGIRFGVYPALLEDGTTPDLTTQAGWDALAAAPRDPAYQAPAVRSGVTGADGVVRFTDLPVGAYWVVEDAHGSPEGRLPSEPFLVTLPMTHPVDSDRWLYTVHAYPKSHELRFTMAIDEGGARVPGDTVQWHIRTAIPHGRLTGLQITDTLDPRLTHVGHTVSINTSQARAGARATLDEGTHFILDRDGQALTFTMTDAGLDLLDASGGGELAISLRTSVHPDGAPESDLMEIPNSARLFVNGSTAQASAAYAPPTKWGTLEVQVCEKCTGQPMVDAAFRLFRTESDALAGRNAVMFGASDVIEVDAQGIADLGALNASAWHDGVLLPDDQWASFYLVEARTPTTLSDGTVIPVAPLGEPMPVHVVRHHTDVDTVLLYTDPSDDCARPAPVPDPPAPAPTSAPASASAGGGGTASTGAQIAGVGGAALLALVLGWLMFRTDRRQEHVDA